MKRQSLLQKSFSILIITTFFLTGTIEDMAGLDWGKVFASSLAPINTGSLENIKESGNILKSFHTDLFTGRATTSVGIFTPPGRGGLTPQLALSYSSGS